MRHHSRLVRTGLPGALALLFLTGIAALPATAQERLCDPSFENCRAPLIDLIRSETVGIDVAFWFMTDSRYTTELIRRFEAGVPVRVLVDTRANATYPLNADRLKELADAGIPMRQRTASGILHWKMMLFAGQNRVQFSAANYSSQAFVPVEPYLNYTDEAVYFTDDPNVVNSFKTKYDDLWTNTSAYKNYANVSGTLQRHYPSFSKDPELNFPPAENFRTRSVQRYNAETQQIDATMFRITDRAHTDALIKALDRGVPVRLITDYGQYTNVDRLWHSWNVDRLYMAGAEIRWAGDKQGRSGPSTVGHQGTVHQKSTLLYGQGMTIFGSSNWTSPSATSQEEHNYFTTKGWFFAWFRDQFERKWNNLTGNVETEPFTPLPPDRPTYIWPNDGATGLADTVKLEWYGGPWAHVYDVYFGTDPNPPLLAADLALGPSRTGTERQSHTISGLAPGTTYYWRIESRTMADLRETRPARSFTTGGSTGPPPPAGELGPGDVLLYASKATVLSGGWRVVNDSTAAGGARIAHPDAGAPKLDAPLAEPTHYFEMRFEAEAGTPYRIWIRGNAEKDHWANDSVFAQFSGTVDGNGQPVYRIGTTSATTINLEDCSGCGLAGWGWQDNGWGRNVLGPQLRFAESGAQTLRIQTREDGLSIDQIMFSPEKFLTTAPGALKNDTTIFPESGDAGGGEPAPVTWSSADIGSVGLAGDAGESAGTFAVRGSGADIWGTADAFRYLYWPFSGDGEIVARVATLDNTHHWAKAGVMFRESLHAGSRHAFMLVSPGRGLAFQRRVEPSDVTTHTDGGGGTAPQWVRLVRSGTTFEAYRSGDGIAWVLVGTETIAMWNDIYVGLAVTSHDNSKLARATFDGVRVSGGVDANTPPTVELTSPVDGASFEAPATIGLTADAADADGTVVRVDFYAGATLLGSDAEAPYAFTWTDVPAGSYTLRALATDDGGAATWSDPVSVTVTAGEPQVPPGWSSLDIGFVGVPGAAEDTSTGFAVHGSGEDIWGTADGFHYLYWPMTGDAEIVARVTGIEHTHHWAKAGVMLRESLTAGSAHAFMLVSAARGVAFQRRVTTGGESTHTAGANSAAPYWVKLTREGNTFRASQSADGLTWTLVGTESIPMAADIHVGLAVTSHTNSARAAGTFDSVEIR